MKIDNFSANYSEDIYIGGDYASSIKPGSTRKMKGGYVSFRVALEGDEGIKEFEKFASKVQKLTEQ